MAVRSADKVPIRVMRSRKESSASDRSTAFFISNSTSRCEFAAVVDRLADETHLAVFECVRRAIESSDARDPEMIVLGQSYRGEVSQEQLSLLRRRFPISRIICLLGSWSEGETRSGTPLPGLERWYAHQFLDRLITESSVDRRLNLPITASNEERWLSVAAHRRPAFSDGLLVVVMSHDASLADAISSACQTSGLTTLCTTPDSLLQSHGPTLVVYDAQPDFARRAHEIRGIKQRMPDADILALIDFPRIEERHQVLDLGATEILSKPFVVDHLLTRIALCVSGRRLRSSEATDPENAV
jgi:hypothetical protein